MAGGQREKIMMLSTGKTVKGKSTGTYYTTKRNKRATEKLELNKFDPRAWDSQNGKSGMHVVFKEKKLPKSS